ncbi:MAG: hypothetical protein ACRDLA_06160, partial [Thermoleophilaceae bacterium]
MLAGALGSGVADRLDPYGADDPDTESVIADERLEAAGFRETGVVVLVESAPRSRIQPRSRDGRERIAALAREIRADRDVASVTSVASAGGRALVSRDGDSTYLA